MQTVRRSWVTGLFDRYIVGKDSLREWGWEGVPAHSLMVLAFFFMALVVLVYFFF